MTQFLFSRTPRALALWGLVTLLVVGLGARAALADPPVHPVHPAHPDTPSAATAANGGNSTAAKPTPVAPVDTSACTPPVLTQPFLWAKDRNWYTLVPGQTPDSYTGAGWTLTGGARVVSTRLHDGQSGPVLDLPSGAKAVSPAICVTSADPAARAMVRNVVGAQGIAFYISYAGRRTWDKPQKTGQFHGRHGTWTPSTRINLLPSHRTAGWQIARFVFVAAGKGADIQLYDFYVDPRMKA